MKLLYFGDLHNSDTQPRYRIDDFEQTRKDKVKEIIQIGKREGVRAFLQAGDFLSKAKLPVSYLTEIKREWGFIDGINDVVSDVLLDNKSEKDLVEAVKNSTRIPMIGIVGNHELVGNNISTYSDTSLSSLVESGFMKLASKDNPIILKDTDGTTVAITGSNYHIDIDGSDKSAYIVDEKLADYHIHLVHGLLMKKNCGTKFEHTTVQEIAYDTKADLTISGHDHIGFDLMELDNKLFCNPGAPVRLSAEVKEIKRKPKVLILDITKAGIKVKEIYLETAKEGNEVLSRNHINQKKAKGIKIDEIASVINKANVEKGLDITQIINNIAKNDNLKPEIANEAVDRILAKMNDVDTYSPVGKYYITSLELENFECHAHSFFEFSEGLNILAGESRNGKSSIIRALSEVYEGKMKNPRKSIRHNETYFKIIVTTNTGWMITRIVENKPKGKNKNGWIIFDPNTGEEEYLNTKGLSKVQEILGINYIKLTEKNKVGINFSLQGKSWFYLGDNMTAPDKAKLLGVPFGAHYADAVLKEVNAQSKKVVSEINFIDNEIEKLNTSLEGYRYLKDLNDVINKADIIKDEIIALKEKISAIKTLLEEKKLIESKMKLIENVIDVFQKNESIHKAMLKEVEDKQSNISEIKNVIANKKEVLMKGKEIRAIFNELQDIHTKTIEVYELEKEYVAYDKKRELISTAKELEAEKAKVYAKGTELHKVVDKLKINKDSEINDILELIAQIKEKREKLEQVNDILVEKNKIAKKKKLAKSIIDKMSFNNTMLIEAENLLTSTIDIKKEIEARNKVKTDINKQEDIRSKAISEVNRLIPIYKQELTDLGTCPICQSTIDISRIDSIVANL